MVLYRLYKPQYLYTAIALPPSAIHHLSYHTASRVLCQHTPTQHSVGPGRTPVTWQGRLATVQSHPSKICDTQITNLMRHLLTRGPLTTPPTSPPPPPNKPTTPKPYRRPKVLCAF